MIIRKLVGKSRNPDILGLQKYIGIIVGDKGFIIQQPWKRNLIFVIENVTFRRTFIKLFLSIEKKVISVPMYLLLYGADTNKTWLHFMMIRLFKKYLGSRKK